MDEAKRGEALWGLDLDLVAGRDSAIVQSNPEWSEAEAASIPFSLADGALLDISFKGGYLALSRLKHSRGAIRPSVISCMAYCIMSCVEYKH